MTISVTFSGRLSADSEGRQGARDDRAESVIANAGYFA
jgi:hypothetical protein